MLPVVQDKHRQNPWFIARDLTYPENLEKLLSVSSRVKPERARIMRESEKISNSRE